MESLSLILSQQIIHKEIKFSVFFFIFSHFFFNHFFLLLCFFCTRKPNVLHYMQFLIWANITSCNKEEIYLILFFSCYYSETRKSSFLKQNKFLCCLLYWKFFMLYMISLFSLFLINLVLTWQFFLQLWLPILLKYTIIQYRQIIEESEIVN